MLSLIARKPVFNETRAMQNALNGESWSPQHTTAATSAEFWSAGLWKDGRGFGKQRLWPKPEGSNRH